MYTRADWGARTPPRSMTPQSTVREAFIHHSSGENGRSFNTLTKQKAHVRSIQDYHIDVKGWSDIGYAFMVFQWVGIKDLRPVPRIFQCRETRWVPAAQEGHNTNTLPICVVGDGGIESLTSETIAAIAQLIRKYPHIASQNIRAHRDVVHTTCPGSKFAYQIPLIRMRARHS